MGSKLLSPSLPPDLHSSITGSCHLPDLCALQCPMPQTLNIFSYPVTLPSLMIWVLLMPLNTMYTLLIPSVMLQLASVLNSIFTCPLGWPGCPLGWLTGFSDEHVPSEAWFLASLSVFHLLSFQVLRPSTSGSPSLSSFFLVPAAHPTYHSESCCSGSSHHCLSPGLLEWPLCRGHYPFNLFSIWQPE